MPTLVFVFLVALFSVAGADEDEPAAARPPAVLFVFDASGSMLKPIEGRTRDEVARSVMASVLKSLRPDVRAGLVTFGHRRKGDCKDLEVLAPVGTERSKIADAVTALKPKGETPLADSIRLAVQQIREYEGSSSIVVVSDGKDECKGDPCAAARDAIASGVRVRMHVVGFDVGRPEAEQLQCIAREGKGKYFSAANASQLGKALQEVEREVSAPPSAAAAPDSACAPPKRGTTKPITCQCSAEATKLGSVWGTDLYTDDSSVCRAAVHAGVIKEAGGKVTVYPYGPQISYQGSERNGVYSSDYGNYPGSFGFTDKLAASEACPPRFDASDASKPLACVCSAKATEEGSVWGTDVYTVDSSLCRAALHAGVVPASGGKITAYPMPGRASYDGEERNGVSSGNYPAYDRSFAFRPDVPEQTPRCELGNLVEGQPLTCRCRAADVSGSVWGTDVYTGDSSICGAAVHAGVIPSSGGTVTLKAAPGQESYSASERNGIQSQEYGAYGTSFTFQK